MKRCGVLGLTSPISKNLLLRPLNFRGKITCDLKGKSFQNVIGKVKSLKKECDIATSNTFDVATSFDGSWSSKGWTANKGIVSAIAEQTCEVLHINGVHILSAQRWKKRKVWDNYQDLNI